jgi:hypothetical protein
VIETITQILEFAGIGDLWLSDLTKLVGITRDNSDICRESISYRDRSFRWAEVTVKPFWQFTNGPDAIWPKAPAPRVTL